MALGWEKKEFKSEVKTGSKKTYAKNQAQGNGSDTEQWSIYFM